MSCFNTQWILDNFDQTESFTYFEVGTAQIVPGDSTICKLHQAFPGGKFYGFEGAEIWHETNEIIAKRLGIQYISSVVGDIDGEILFYPSLTQDGKEHHWSSSIFELGDGSKNCGKVYGEPYVVSCLKLETFCKTLNVVPDFIHIDAEGAEFKIFQNIGKYKPKCIWTEISSYPHYNTGTTFQEFNSLLEKLGYIRIFTTARGDDALYCRTDFKTTQYIE